MVMVRSCMAIKSRNASFANSRVMGDAVKFAVASTRRKAPSNSRILERMRLAIKKATSSGRVVLASSAFLLPNAFALIYES